MTARCGSVFCSSSLSAARRLRAPSSPSAGASTLLVAERAASTSAAGLPARVFTSCSAAATGGSSADAGASGAFRIDFVRMSRARSPLGSKGSGARSSRASCSARTRGSRTSSGTASSRPGSITSWPSRGRTSHSSRSACSASPGCLASHGSPPRSSPSRRSPPTCSRSAGSPPWFGQVSQAGSLRWPGSCRGRATAGTSWRSARRSCSPGPQRACSSPASNSRLRPWDRSSCCCRGCGLRSRDTR